MTHVRWFSVLLLMMLSAVPGFAQTQTGPAAQEPQQQQKKEKEKDSLRLVWDDRPRLRAGNDITVDFRVKLQTDVRVSRWDLEDEGGTFELSRRRVGAKGELTKYVDFEVEAELRKENPWRDVFVNVKPASAFEVQAGKFKMPFSADQLTSPTEIDFVNRSLIAGTIAPARDIGLMVHGRLFHRLVTYEFGAFRNDGENARLEKDPFVLPGEALPPNEHSAAWRVTIEPFRRASGPKALERLQVGVAFTTSDVPEGLNSLEGKSVLGFTFFEPMYVLGRRWRVGAELVWTPGPYSVKAEYARSDEARRRQGLGDVDLSDFTSSGWYISGSWAVTGESKSGGISPRKPLFRGGFGALELAVRYEELGFGSESNDGPAFSNPRADKVLENRDRVWTLGATWYLNKWAKVQVNGLRESFQDVERSPIPGQANVWSGVCRFQFVL